MTNPNKLADALRKAFDLGQRYWMLADSESYSDNRKSADVLARHMRGYPEAASG
jgi:hypothetical protein